MGIDLVGCLLGIDWFDGMLCGDVMVIVLELFV